jgi:hypothetical protein
MVVWTGPGIKRMRIALFLAGVLAWPAFGDQCFCLVDSGDNIWFDCREQTRAPRTNPLLFCTDAATGEQIELTGHQGLTRVTDGDGHCTPCRLSDAADLRHTIRGEDDEPNTKGKAVDPAQSGTESAAGKDRP